MTTDTKNKPEVKKTQTAKAPPKRRASDKIKVKPTILSFLLDESGSMADVWQDTIGGFNSFMEKQKAEPGEMIVSLIKFDGQEPYNVVFEGKAIKDVPALTKETYTPRSATPLIDAAHRMIMETSKLAAKTEANVLCIIQTDGHENASKENTTAQLKGLIETRKAEGWVFVFLGADINAYGIAASMGINTGSTMSYGKSATSQVFDTMHSHTVNYRSTGVGSTMNFASDEKASLGDKFDPQAHTTKAAKK